MRRGLSEEYGRVALGGSKFEEYGFLPRGEYEHRLERARSLMEAYGLDALFITDGINFFYFTGGSPPFSYARPYTLILPREREPVIVVALGAVHLQSRESWITDIRTPGVVWDAPVEFLKDTFEELGLKKGRIGAELGREQRLGISYNDFVRLKKELPEAEFVDASRLIWDMRMVKSRCEVDLMRKACEIIDRVHEAVPELLEPGMTEKNVLGIILRMVGELGGFAPFAFMNSGPYNYDHDFGPTYQYPRATNRVIEKGNMLFLDLGCNYKGYWCDYSRVHSIGIPSEKMVKLHKFAEKLTNKCVEFVKPGIEVNEIVKYCYREVKGTEHEAQLTPDRIGHAIGLMCTEPPNIALDERALTIPGMTFTIEPYFCTTDVFLNIEQNIVVTENGYELLTKASTEMKIV